MRRLPFHTLLSSIGQALNALPVEDYVEITVRFYGWQLNVQAAFVALERIATSTGEKMLKPSNLHQLYHAKIVDPTHVNDH